MVSARLLTDFITKAFYSAIRWRAPAGAETEEAAVSSPAVRGTWWWARAGESGGEGTRPSSWTPLSRSRNRRRKAVADLAKDEEKEAFLAFWMSEQRKAALARVPFTQ